MTHKARRLIIDVIFSKLSPSDPGISTQQSDPPIQRPISKGGTEKLALVVDSVW